MTARLLLLAGLVAACSAEQRPTAGFSAPRGAPRNGNAEPTIKRAEQRQALAARLLDVRSRLHPDLEAPATKPTALCPPGLSQGAHFDTTVLVRVRDARYEPHDIFPLELRSRLESNELGALGSHYVGGAAVLWNLESAELSDPSSAPDVEQLLDSLQPKRFAAVLHVTSYARPNVFRRKGATQPEWNAGAIGARFVVYDLNGKQPLCEESLIVRGTATEAPLRKSLRENTRTRLHLELLDRAWQAMRESLSRMSHELRMPAEDVRGRVSQRW